MTLIASVVVVATLFITNPASIGPVGVTLWFLALLAALTGGLSLVLFWFKRLVRSHHTESRQLQVAARQATLIALGLVIFLALSSLRQLSLGDVVLVALLLGLSEFYLRARV
jgi:hypothetical protein